MKVTIFQQDTLSINDSRFALFCYKLEKDTLIILPEYTLNPFFAELKLLKKDQIAIQTTSQIRFLSYLSARHNIHFVAPIIRHNKKKLYKEIIYITPQNALKFNNNIDSILAKQDIKRNKENQLDSKVDSNKKSLKPSILDFEITQPSLLSEIEECLKIYPAYRQQRLIDYQHWNEARFFSNHNNKLLKKPLIFSYKGFNVATLFGFEVHFDEFWLSMKKEGVDMVLLPCANTFDSNMRWREICKMRAFLNGCVVIRANRVGTSVVNENQWVFYGDSFIAMPNGEIIDNLRDKESMLSLEVYKNKVLEMAREWGFRKNF